MIHAWNWHMSDVFHAEWVSCLDESMSIWKSRWTCSGSMFVPRKPHPVGNEYHTIVNGPMWGFVRCGNTRREGQTKRKKGKINTTNMERPGACFLNYVSPLFMTGKVVILDSGFCALISVLALKKMGAFSAALIHKRRYRPRYVKGEEIEAHFEDAPVGDRQRLPCKINGAEFDLICLK